MDHRDRSWTMILNPEKRKVGGPDPPPSSFGRRTLRSSPRGPLAPSFFALLSYQVASRSSCRPSEALVPTVLTGRGTSRAHERQIRPETMRTPERAKSQLRSDARAKQQVAVIRRYSSPTTVGLPRRHPAQRLLPDGTWGQLAAATSERGATRPAERKAFRLPAGEWRTWRRACSDTKSLHTLNARANLP